MLFDDPLNDIPKDVLTILLEEHGRLYSNRRPYHMRVLEESDQRCVLLVYCRPRRANHVQVWIVDREQSTATRVTDYNVPRSLLRSPYR